MLKVVAPCVIKCSKSIGAQRALFDIKNYSYYFNNVNEQWCLCATINSYNW